MTFDNTMENNISNATGYHCKKPTNTDCDGEAPVALVLRSSIKEKEGGGNGSWSKR
jgi:hypothetical protein